MTQCGGYVNFLSSHLKRYGEITLLFLHQNWSGAFFSLLVEGAV